MMTAPWCLLYLTKRALRPSSYQQANVRSDFLRDLKRGMRPGSKCFPRSVLRRFTAAYQSCFSSFSGEFSNKDGTAAIHEQSWRACAWVRSSTRSVIGWSFLFGPYFLRRDRSWLNRVRHASHSQVITWSGSLEYRRAEPGSSLSDNPRKGVAPPDVHAFDPHFLTHGSYSATTRGSHFFGFAGNTIHHRPKGRSTFAR